MRMERSAGAFARAALLPLSLLCFPVSRGSPLLRMIGIPFQHAVKYHRWLGHLTLTLYSTHSILFIWVFATEHDASKLLQWPLTGISYISGTFAFATGVIMWLTAVAPIRRRWFEVFYVTHHLYLVFFAFLVFHVGPKMSAYTAGGIFLFFVDRFIRMVQSRHSLSLAAAKVYPSGVIELKLRKSPGVAYNALSSVFVNIPCVSRLQWHPFSITSSPLDDSRTLTVCIKPLGKWTKRLHRTLVASDSKASPSSCTFSNLLFAEGPYGHASDFYLKYDALLLVAGGIGITPFIAILRDLFHRHQAKERGLPRSIQLIWTVKRGSELVLLTDIFPPKRYSNATMHFECHAFLTGQDTQYDTGEVSLIHGGEPENEVTMNFPNVSGCEGSLSTVSATGNGLWIASLTAVASFATIFVMYVSDRSTSLQSPSGNPLSSHHVALLYFVSMLMGIGGFGGVVVLVWSILRNINSGKSYKSASVYDEEGTPASCPLPDRENVWQRNLLDNTNVMRGRPNIRKYFNAAAEWYRGKDVGVLVSGPASLQQSVAGECKAHYMSSSVESPFYFHSVSFDM
ncbi:hypothetical protein KC19_12G045000 [Ceratodon purpureus]|nr:hypothetical protein KC19_12G045000 [Ceratodon purpureus]